MNKKLLIRIAVALVVVTTLVVALAGCSDSTTFAKFVKFKVDKVEKVEIVSEYNVIKEVDATKVFEAFADTKFKKTKTEKFDSDWDVNRKMTINFYIKDQSGHYSIVINTGARAMDGFDYKSITGFYTIENSDELLGQLNILFYQH